MYTLIQITDALSIPLKELKFRASRSGGPGGQNVNKLATRVELLFDVANSRSLLNDQRRQILESLKSKIDADGVLRIVSQESRSQWLNKETAIAKLTTLLQRALRPKKKRVSTKPSRVSKERRIKEKKIRSERKQSRRGINSDS